MNARLYVTAERDMRAGGDWRAHILMAHAPDPAAAIVQDLETDAAYTSCHARVERFRELLGDGKGASKSTYHRLTKRLREQRRLTCREEPPIQLRRTRPPAPPPSWNSTPRARRRPGSRCCPAR